MKKFFLFLLFLSAFSIPRLSAQCSQALDLNLQGAGFSISPADPYDPSINYGCLSTAANRAFGYGYLKVCASGTLSIAAYNIASSSADSDIIVWGPFSTNTNICSNLTAGNIAGCANVPMINDTINLGTVNTGDIYMVCISSDTSISAYQYGFWFGSAVINNTCAISLGCLANLNPSEMICNVTVDSTTQKYKITWEEIPTNPVSHFEIYRYINSSQTVLIDTVQVSSLSEYIDMNSNPNAVAERYEIYVQDTCNMGGWGLTGAYAEPVFCIANVSTSNTVNLSWSDYIIGGSPAADFYVIMRGASPATMVPIDTVADFIHLYTDNNPLPGQSYYKIGVMTSISCVPSHMLSSVQSYSNNAAVAVVGLAETGTMPVVNVFPNPSSGEIRLSNIPPDCRLEIRDNAGRLVQQTDLSAVKEQSLDLTSLENGLYQLHFICNSGQCTVSFIRL